MCGPYSIKWNEFFFSSRSHTHTPLAQIHHQYVPITTEERERANKFPVSSKTFLPLRPYPFETTLLFMGLRDFFPTAGVVLALYSAYFFFFKEHKRPGRNCQYFGALCSGEKKKKKKQKRKERMPKCVHRPEQPPSESNVLCIGLNSQPSVR